MGIDRYAYYHVDFSTGKPIISKAQAKQSSKILIEFIAQVKEMYKVDEIYLGSFSQGAIMSYSIGLTNVGLIKGIIALSGRILAGKKRLIKKVKTLKNLKPMKFRIKPLPTC